MEDVHGNKYRIVLVDDEQEFLKDAKDFIREFFKGEPVEIDSYSSENEFLWNLQDGKEYDLYILDLKMPKIRGLELAGEIRKFHETCPILFLTDYEYGALGSYQVGAANYLLKTGYRQRIGQSLMQCYEAWKEKKDDYYLYHYKDAVRVISCHEIRYLQFDSNERMLTIKTKKEELKERKSLSAILKELNKDYFMVTAKGIAVNLLHVTGMEGTEVLLRGGERVIISPRYKKAFLERLGEVIGTHTFGRL